MLTRFLAFIKENKLIDKDEKVLVAVSGGIDSMTMLQLFQKTSYKFACVHCNFKLRNSDSEKDERFITSYCASHNIPLYKTSFETIAIAKKRKISIQEAARDLRYQYFDDIANQHNYHKIAVAHNLNDTVETFLINLTRGSGIAGLTGISVKYLNIIRPLMFAHRQEIEEYVQNNEITYRTDKSNFDTKYTRNKIRHEILPLFEQINPSFLNTIAETTERLSEVSLIYHESIEALKAKYMKEKSGLISINKSFFLNTSNTVRYEFLKAYGFSIDTVQKLANEHHTGKQYISGKYCLTIDREAILLEEIKETTTNWDIDISRDGTTAFPIYLKWHSFELGSSFKLPRSKHLVAFDKDKLNNKMQLRFWKEGDFFYPLGLGKKKKLSDFFIDQKVPLPLKNKIPMLCSGDDIVWITNYQIDDRFKITAQTKQVIQFEIL